MCTFVHCLYLPTHVRLHKEVRDVTTDTGVSCTFLFQLFLTNEQQKKSWTTRLSCKVCIVQRNMFKLPFGITFPAILLGVVRCRFLFGTSDDFRVQ